MGTATITPPVSAPAAAPSTPAPAAPASTTPTPAAEPTTTTPSTSTPESTGDSTLDRIRAGWEKAKGSVAAEEEPATEEGTEEPVGEEPATEAAVEEPTTEEPATEPETPPAEAADALPELDDGTTLAPQDFAKAIKGNAAVEEFFNANPELKGQVFQALRQVNEARDIRALIPDVETAREAVQGSALYKNFDSKFLAADSRDNAKGFLEMMAKEALIVDEKGEPLLKDGKYQFHPALQNVFGRIVDNHLSLLAEQAQQSGDERLSTALEIIREVTSPSSPGLDEVPEEMKPFADKLKADRAALDAEKAEGARKTSEAARVANEQSIERAESSAANTVQRQLEPLFKKAGLSPAESEWALNKIGASVDAELEKHGLYQAILSEIEARQPGEEREKAHRAHMLKYTNPVLGRIAAGVIREAKAGTMTRQTDRQTTVAAQTHASRTEPRGTTVTPPSNNSQGQSLRTQVIEEYKSAHGGEEPEANYVFAEVMKRQRGGRAR